MSCLGNSYNRTVNAITKNTYIALSKWLCELQWNSVVDNTLSKGVLSERSPRIITLCSWARDPKFIMGSAVSRKKKWKLKQQQNEVFCLLMSYWSNNGYLSIFLHSCRGRRRLATVEVDWHRHEDFFAGNSKCRVTIPQSPSIKIECWHKAFETPPSSERWMQSRKLCVNFWSVTLAFKDSSRFLWTRIETCQRQRLGAINNVFQSGVVRILWIFNFNLKPDTILIL